MSPLDQEEIELARARRDATALPRPRPSQHVRTNEGAVFAPDVDRLSTGGQKPVPPPAKALSPGDVSGMSTVSAQLRCPRAAYEATAGIVDVDGRARLVG